MLLEEYQPRSELVVPRTEIRGPACPVVDFHGHYGALYSDAWREMGSPTIDIHRCVEEARASGIVKAVNLDGFFEGFRGFSMERFYEAMELYPDFFIPFVSVNTELVGSPGFEPETRRHLVSARARGVRGIKIFKVVTLGERDGSGLFRPARGLPIDDPRLGVIWETAAELGMPVLVHIGDPRAFFRPVDARNERYEELVQHPEWQYAGPGLYAFEELLDMQERLLAANPRTSFVIPHGGSWPENLAWVDGALGRHPNMSIDISERIAEFGRAPYSARAFFIKHQDRILFGTDAWPGGMARRYEPYFRFLETFDEYFDHGPYNTRWKIYGIGLPAPALEKIYRLNAERLLAPGASPADQVRRDSI